MYERRRTPQLVGHMGYPHKLPENTVASAVAAHEAGADMIEVDVSVTADGHAVAMHGPDLGRATNGAGPIRRADLAAIRELTATLGDDEIDGVGVPLVAEIIDAVPGAAFNLDLKVGAAVGPVLDLVRERELEDRCVITGCKAARVGRVRRARSGAAVLLNLNRFDVVMARSRLGPWWFATRYRRLLGAPDVVALNINHRLVTPTLVERVNRIGAEVWTFTVDDPDRIRELRDMGVSSITTNRIGEIAPLS